MSTYEGPECKKCGGTTRYLPRKERREKTGACVTCKLKKSADWRKEKPALSKALQRRWREDNPERVCKITRESSRKRRRDPAEKPKLYARALIQRKIQRGEMNKIYELKCRRCDNQAEHYHHPDYSVPWLVIPLCRTHHDEEHNG